MKYLDRIKFGNKEKEDSMLAADTDQEVASEEGSTDAVDEAGIFDDFDGKRKLVEEWWLQSEVEDVVEEPEEEEKDEEEEEKKEKGDTDDLIHNLTSGSAVDDEEENIVLRKATEAMGEISVDELLDLGRTVLQEMGVGVEKSE